MSKGKRVAGMAIGAFAMLAMAVPAASQPTEGVGEEVFKLTTAITVPGKPLVSFDISWVDPVLKKYFLADRSNKAIEILDLTTSPPTLTQVVNNRFAGFTGNNDTSGPDGVLTANDHTELWVGDNGGGGAGPGQVWVLNTDASEKKIGKPNPIPINNPVTNKPSTTRADELCYDPNDNLIMIASPAENAVDPPNANKSAPFVSFISTKGANAYTVVSQLVFDGKNAPEASNGLEQCGWSPKTGLFYQNVPEVNGAGDDTSPGVVAVIDPKTVLAGTPKVETSFPVDIDKCAGPQGMAIGPSDQILLGCNAASPDGRRNTVIINTNSGAVEAVLPDLGGADQVWFNEGDGHYFIPSCNTECRSTVTTPPTGQELLGVIDSRGFRLDQTVVIAKKSSSTASGASRRIHSVAADPDTKQVFLPIPAIGGGTPIFAPTLCGDTAAAPTGCIAVLAPTPTDDRSRLVQ